MVGGRFFARAGLALSAWLLVVVFATGAADAATFSTTVVTGDDAGEPGIAVGKDGAIYINAPSGLLSNLPGSPSWIYKSTNGGAGWAKLDPRPRGNFPRGGGVALSVAPRPRPIFRTDLCPGSAPGFSGSAGGA